MKKIYLKLNSRVFLRGLLAVLIASWTPASLSESPNSQPADSGKGKPTDQVKGGGQGGSHNDVSIDGLLQEVEKKELSIHEREAVIRKTIHTWQLTMGKAPINNTLHYAAAGEGKTMTAEAIAQYLPEHMIMLKLNANDFKAGGAYRGQEEQKWKNLMADIERRIAKGKHVVLWIDEAHSIMTLDESVRESMKQDILNTKGLSAHFTTTTNEKSILEKDPAFMRRFVSDELKTLSREGRIATLMDLAAETKFKFTPEAIRMIVDKGYVAEASSTADFVKLMERVVTYMNGSDDVRVGEYNDRIRVLNSFIKFYDNPHAALSVDEIFELQEKKKELFELKSELERFRTESKGTEVEDIEKKITDAKAQYESYKAKGNVGEAMMLNLQIIPDLKESLKKEKAKASTGHSESSTDRLLVDKNIVAEVLSKASINGNFSKATILAEDKDLFLNLEKNLSKKVIGHEQAIHVLQEALKSRVAPVESKGNAIPAVVLDGMAGNGKSYLSESVAEAIGYKYKIFYMNNFSGHGALEKAQGQNSGIVDADKGGEITNAIKNNRRLVLELAEFDQADSKVQKMIYELVETGKITDGRGNIIDASEVIVLITMNVSGAYLAKKGEQRRAFEIQYLVEQKQIFSMEEFERTLGEKDGEKKIQYEVMKNLQLDTGKITSAMHSRLAAMIATDSLSRLQAVKVAEMEVSKRFVGHWKRQLRVDFTAGKAVSKQLMRMTYSPDLGMRAFRPAIDEFARNLLIDVYIDDSQLNKVRENGNIHLDFNTKKGQFEISTKNNNGHVEVLQEKAVPNYFEDFKSEKERLSLERERLKAEREAAKTSVPEKTVEQRAIDAAKTSGVAAAADAVPGAAGKPVTKKSVFKSVVEKIWRK